MTSSISNKLEQEPRAQPPLLERPTFLVHRVNAELARVCNPLFRRLGVDLITSRILVILLEQGPSYVGDIVDLMALPQSTVSHQIKRLDAATLIVRQVDKSDNRSYLIKLTTKGRRVASECNAVSATLLDELFSNENPADVTKLCATLEKMATRLSTLSSRKLVN